MLDWLASPIWGAISVFVAVAGMVTPLAYRSWKNKKLLGTQAKGAAQVPPPSEAYALVNRFVSIFKAHGIERIQIPRFLGEESGLTIAHMGDDEKLLNTLSEKVLNDTCDRFGIARDWLDGKSCPIYPRRYYDKNLEGFIDFLEKLRVDHDEVQCCVVKSEKDTLSKDGGDLTIVIVLRGKLCDWGEHEHETIWRYYPLNDTLYWGYKRTRVQIKAMVLAAWQFGVYVQGLTAPEKEINALVEGEIYPGPLLEVARRRRWQPDAYIFAEGESCLVEDGAEAVAVRKEMERVGWMEYLTNKTGPLRLPSNGFRSRSPIDKAIPV